MTEQEKKEYSQQLELLEKNLKEAATAEAKKEIETQIAEIKKLIPDTKALETSISEVKKTADEANTAIGEVKKIAEETQAAVKANQEVIDKTAIFLKERDNGRIGERKIKTIQEALWDSLNEGDNFKNLDMMAKNHKDRQKKFSVELKDAGVITTGNVTGSSVYGQISKPGIIEGVKRKVHVRDLVPMAPADFGNTFTFMRENGAGEGNPETVAQNAAKPLFDFDLIEDTVNFEVIAGRVKFTRKAMNNIRGFIAFLQSRLPEKLLRVEDDQLLNGDGNTPNIKGITHADNSVASTSTADVLIEAIIDDIALLEDTYERYASGILLRPKEYYGFFKNKASDSGVYDLPKNVAFVNGTLYISGIPVFASTAVTDGDYIVGDWQQGAQILVQEGMRIEFFEQDEDNVKYNRITARIEETIAFPVYGPDYFVVGTVPS